MIQLTSSALAPRAAPRAGALAARPASLVRAAVGPNTSQSPQQPQSKGNSGTAALAQSAVARRPVTLTRRAPAPALFAAFAAAAAASGVPDDVDDDDLSEEDMEFIDGRGFLSSTFRLNLSCLCHRNRTLTQRKYTCPTKSAHARPNISHKKCSRPAEKWRSVSP